MTLRATVLATGIVLLLACGKGQAQPAFLPGTVGQGGPILLTAADGQAGPVFANGPVAEASQSAVAAGGIGVGNWGAIQVGFDYLRPTWSKRDFTLAVPAGVGGFPVLGDTGNVDSSFAFVPRIDYFYQFAGANYGLGASGQFLSLNGHLQRDIVSTAGGVGDLSANSSLTIVAVNLLEFRTRVDLEEELGEAKGKSADWLEDWFADLGIGTRYSSINQNYTSALSNSVAGATNVSNRYSSQSFQGFGLTGSMKLTHVLTDDLLAFWNTRCSVLVGENRKESTSNVILGGVAGQGDRIGQNRTEFLPVVEFDVGAEWGRELGERYRDGTAAAVLTVRVAMVGQYWGGVGPLSAGSAQGFSRSDLFLYGVSVLVGLHR